LIQHELGLFVDEGICGPTVQNKNKLAK
jgi:hypothetical protein